MSDAYFRFALERFPHVPRRALAVPRFPFGSFYRLCHKPIPNDLAPRKDVPLEAVEAAIAWCNGYNAELERRALAGDLVVDRPRPTAEERGAAEGAWEFEVKSAAQLLT